MTTRTWGRNLLGRPSDRTTRKAAPRTRLNLEALEDRRVLSTFTVTNTLDNGSVGSLRWAVGLANSTGGADTIIFDSNVFATPKTITLTNGKLTLSDGVTTTITGPGAGLLSISGNKTSQVFLVTGSAAFSGLTITGGVGEPPPGFIASYQAGGGLSNVGTVTLTQCAISGNTAGYYDGGGLFNYRGTATLNSCTISGNTANEGGGLFNDGTLTLSDVTVSANTARTGTGGGGLFNEGTATLINSTVSANLAGYNASGSGVRNYAESVNPPGTLYVRNTIIAGNFAIDSTGGYEPTDVGGPFQSQGNNLIGVQATTAGAFPKLSSGWIGTDLLGTYASPLDARLATLGNYGGPTQTMALLPGSPAINAGANSAGIPTLDQRGRSRVGAVDIGAVESQGYALNAAAGAGQSTYAGTTFAEAIGARLIENVTNAPLPGVAVTFTGPAIGAGVETTPLTATTDATGLASVVVRANGVVGTYGVTATAQALPAASIGISNVLPPRTLTASTLADGTGTTTLRGAVIAFNNDPGTATDTIVLNAGTYALSIGGRGEDRALNGDLDITNSAHTLVIRGSGSTGGGATIIDAKGLDRVFQILSPGTVVMFQNLVITGGLAHDGGPGYGDAAGGGVLNNGGNLTFTNVAFTGDKALGDTIRSASGGAVYSGDGAVVFDGCTFSNNVAQGGSYTIDGYGTGQGGALALGGGAVTISNSSFNSNQAAGGSGNPGSSNSAAFGRSQYGGGGGLGRGGAVWSVSGGTVTVTNTTFSANKATGGQGGDGGANSGTSGFAGLGNIGGNGEGGGLWSGGTGSLAIAGCTFDTGGATGGRGGAGGANTGSSGQAGNAAGPAGDGLGGGLALFGGGPVSIVNTTFSANKATGGQGGVGGANSGTSGFAGRGDIGGNGEGGGLWSRGTGSLSIANSTFDADGATGGTGGTGGANTGASGQAGNAGPAGDGLGGGLALFGGGPVSVVNTSFGGSTATGGAGGAGGSNPGGTNGLGGRGGMGQGGGAWVGSGSGTSLFANSTLAGNAAIGGVGGRSYIFSAVGSGAAGIGSAGGLGVAYGTATVNNTLMASNTGGDLLKSGGTLAGGSNLIGVGTAGTLSDAVNGNRVGNAAAPLIPNLGPLAANGGSTRTMALLAGSPAINAGNNALIPAGVTTDGRGPGFARTYGGTVDIGAFEFQTYATTVTLASSVNPSVAGQPVTFTATVAAQAPGLPTPTGSVTFKDGTTVLVVVPLNAGKAVYTIATIAPGTHQITANYAGDASFNPGVSTLVYWPVFRADTTTLLGKPAPSGTPGMMALSATVKVVAPGAGDPSGTVTFTRGRVTIGTAPVVDGRAMLVFRRSGLAQGPVVATYAGDSRMQVSTSAPGQGFVSRLYQTLLHRQAEPTAVVFWTRQLARGVSRTTVAAAIRQAAHPVGPGPGHVSRLGQTHLHR